MILFITGFHSAPFNRLVRMGDSLASRIEEEVVIQKGASNHSTNKARSFKWMEEELFDKLMEESRVIVCHAGVGSVLDGRRKGKPIIVVPRRMYLGEHYDDHQMEVAKAASESGSAVMVNDIDELMKAIGRLGLDNRLARTTDKKLGLVLALRNTIDELAEG